MENASKALLMSATVLIGITILSLMVYLFIYFSNYAKDVSDENKNNQIAQFNSQFLSYQGKELTFYDVISLANMANDYNKSNNSDFTHISIKIKSVSDIRTIDNFENEQMEKNLNNYSDYIYTDEENGELRKYKIESCIINDTTQYIQRIIIINI